MENMFANLPESLAEEEVLEVLRTPAVRIERIVSTGQASPPGFWYDQAQPEWVLVLAGAAELRIEGEPTVRRMGPGSFVNLPAHVRPRVEWTSADPSTVWLAIHY
jgi:cupin 2 domain-containing protein